MSKELNPIIDRQLEVIGIAVENSSDGMYFIEGVTLSEYRNPRVSFLSRLMNELVVRFPQYQWSEHESLNPKERGIAVRWTLRNTYFLERKTKHDETPKAIDIH